MIDYGLAFRFMQDGKHKEYKEDPRKAHDGTVEFTSRDAHKGVGKKWKCNDCKTQIASIPGNCWSQGPIGRMLIVEL